MNVWERRDPLLNKISDTLRRQNDYKGLVQKSGISKSAFSNLVTGKTRSPHFKTVHFLLQAAGFELFSEYKMQNSKVVKHIDLRRRAK